MKHIVVSYSQSEQAGGTLNVTLSITVSFTAVQTLMTCGL